MTIQTDRLLRLIEVLETVPPEQFMLSGWGHKYSPDTPADYRRGRESMEPCGFAACACGWAALDHELQAQGLWLYESAYEDGRNRIRAVPDQDQYGRVYTLGYYAPDGTLLQEGFQAAAEFFGINFCDAMHLFDQVWYEAPSDYSETGAVTRSAVIRRIKALLADHSVDADARLAERAAGRLQGRSSTAPVIEKV